MTVRSFYDRVWRTESGGIDRDSRRRLEADRDALDMLEPLASVLALDIGIGGGASVEALLRRGARVVAVDLSHEALLRARARTSGAHHVVADAHRLPFRDRRFDRISVFSVLMFLDLPRALPELGRIMKDAGRMAIVEPVAGNPMLAAWRFCSRRYANLAHWYDEAILREHLSRFFHVRSWHTHYLFPPAAILREGRFRSIWMSLEQLFMDKTLLSKMSWIVTAELDKRS
ncbi:MAG: class I SAM-dependent methyltransferase [Candidatus Hydrogenedentota bacterium]